MSQIVRHDSHPHPAANGSRRREPLPAPTAETLDPRYIVRRLWKRRLLIGLVTLLTVVPAVVATFLAIPFYSSSAMIQVNPDPVQVLPYRDIADSGSGVYYEVYMSTQDQILKSPSLLARVSARLAAEPAGSPLSGEIPFLGNRFTAVRVPNSQLFKISYQAPSPDTAARVVNVFADEYIRQHHDARQETREKATESLQRELDGLEQRMQLSEKQLVTYARRQNMLSAQPAEGDLVHKRLTSLDQQVSDAESEVALARNRLEMQRKLTVETFPEALTNGVIANLTTRHLQAEQELTNLLATFGENWPAVVTKRGEIRLIDEQLGREKAVALARSVEQAQLEFRTALNKLMSASGMLAEQKSAVDRYNDALIEYNILRREVETNRKLHEGLLERLRQANVQKGVEFGNLQIVDPGRPSEQPETPHLSYAVGLASLLGLTLGVGVALLRDYCDNSVSTLEDVEELTGLPSLGSLPSNKFLAAGSENGSAQPRIGLPPVQALNLSLPAAVPPVPPSPPEVAESVHAICASILLSQSDQPLRAIAITSAVPGEGKTTLAGQIGRALADGGARTLLVEADLRNPLLAESFGIGPGEGLSLYLSGHSAAPRICETGQANLFVAPAGPRPPNPMALLGSERMKAFLEQVTKSFRFVLLDTPPILAVADARVLAAKADGLILVVRAEMTAKSLIVRAQTILENSGINLLGVVLNSVHPEEFQSNSYYKYYARS